MFSKKITDTDAFLDMPMSTQCLYFHMNMEADDDGFLGNAKTIKRKIGASDDDLKLLIAKQFIIPFENGVVVIKDWKIHNYIRKDTYNPTIYGDQAKELSTDENGAYTFRGRAVDEPSPQVRLGKDRLGKETIKGQDEPSNQDSIEERFNKIWKLYPKKTKRKDALAAYKRAIKNGVTDEAITKGVENYIKDSEANPWRKIMEGGRWFQKERWNDEYETKTKGVTNNQPREYRDLGF